jgi:predicted RNA binding protein YcfA (HicA-like mRNA interferase family)
VQPPLCSSRQIVAALERLGFEHKRTKGDHATYARRVEGEITRTTVVVLGKAEVPRGTLRSIIKLAGLTFEEFCAALDA